MNRLVSFSFCALVGALVLAAPIAATPAKAQDLTPTFHLEGTADVMLTDTYRDRFDWGGRYAVRAGLEIIGPLAIQLGFANAWFPVDGQDPGNLYALELGARAYFALEEGAGIGGPFVDFNAGVGLTGDLARFVFDVGAGWDFFPHELFGLGPVFRYGQIVQPDDEAIGADAFLLSFGVNFTLRLDLGGPPPEPIAEAEPAPPGDSDGDGVTDDRDQCVDEPEDRDHFQDDDGCPEEDNDQDGIGDELDECPDAPETRNDFQDDDGCPDEAPAVVVRDRDIGELLPQQIRFRLGSARISGRFQPEIDSLCRLLNEEQPNARIRVIGHADEQGTPASNHRLGSHRAGAIAERLVTCGVDPLRIESRSYGDTHLSCQETTDDCHSMNRRVELRLLPPE